ncbi:MAG TPA: hypothetical protein VE443_14225 [Beijerinckiaceae bacterium]|jgi:hypothetical protein|nr:hypothetical protein [Microvirga sp.]HZB39141.1 hypothetical protein [Beijerinckiaceae bacterium]
MAIATLTRDLAPQSIRTGPSLPRRMLLLLVVVGEVWAEMQAMRREAQRRYPHLEL